MGGIAMLGSLSKREDEPFYAVARAGRYFSRKTFCSTSRTRFKRVCTSQMVRGKTRVPGGKALGLEERTNNKLKPHMVATPGLNLSHTGGRRVLSPLRHPLLPIIHSL